MSIYLYPFLVDLVDFLVMMRVADASGRELHVSNLEAALLMAAFSVSYLIWCLVIGRFLKSQDVRPVVAASVGAVLITSVPLFFTRSFWPTFWLLGAFGFALAFFFNSFQTYMRGQSPAGSLGVAIGRYTFAWSIGIGCGFLFGGLLRSLGGPLGLAALSSCICLGILGALLLGPASTSSREPAAPDGGTAPHGFPCVDRRYVVIGWLLIFAVSFSQRPLTTYVPKFNAEAGLPAWVAGVFLFTLFLTQAIMGPVCTRFPGWLYRRKPLAVSQILAVGCLALLWASPGIGLSFGAAVIFGGVCGFMGFTSVYYVSNDERSSHNVGVNEAMVGAGSILGVVLSGAVISLSHNPYAFYPLVIGVMLALAVLEVFWLLRGGYEPGQKGITL